MAFGPYLWHSFSEIQTDEEMGTTGQGIIKPLATYPYCTALQSSNSIPGLQGGGGGNGITLDKFIPTIILINLN